jgi:frataxin-like iron-binding protein CyaY
MVVFADQVCLHARDHVVWINVLQCNSGPKRYDFDPKIQNWTYSRDGTTLRQLLEQELTGPFNDIPADELLGEGPFFSISGS